MTPIALDPSNHDASLKIDLAIIGAGPVGLALAGWLAQRSATSQLAIALIDAHDASAAAADSLADPRAIAISQGSRMLLEPLAWPSDASVIRQIHISQSGYFGSTMIDHNEHHLPALGYVVRYSQLAAQLAAVVKTTSIAWLPHTTAQTSTQDGQSVKLALSDANNGPRALYARLVIHAEGGLYPTAPSASPADTNSARGNASALKNVLKRDYQQTAIVAAVRVESPRPGVAWERFTREGPLALLPLGGAQNEFSLVWCARPDTSKARMALSDAVFLQALQQAFGHRMGRFTQIGARATFALGLNAQRQLVSARAAAIGNAAQTLHPVAGQGLNLGLRDAYALVEALVQYGATPAALRYFVASRARDRYLTIAATDTLARVFTADFAPLATLRGLALASLDFLPPAKTWLARQMIFGQRN